MKRFKAAAVLLALAIPAGAGALEFQTPGALGIGRAGVARTTDAYATFWNPAGLAFYENSFSTKFNAAAGVAISSSLADNVDKISKLDTGKLSYTSTGNAVTDAAAASASTAQAVQALAIIDDIDKTKGSLTVNVDLALAFQYRNFALGIGAVSELGAGSTNIDNNNLRIGDAGSPATNSSTTNITNLVRDMNGGTTPTVAPVFNQKYFTQTQWQSAVDSIKSANPGVTDAQAKTLVNNVGNQLATPGTNLAGLSTDQVVSALTASNVFSGGSIDKNNSTIELVGIVIAEVPVSYGHKFDLGAMGKLGLGATLKVMQGTVYAKQALIFKDFKSGSGDFTSKVKDNKTETTAFGVDLGALWRIEDLTAIGPINIGFVAKNLNSPKFDGPAPSAGAANTSITVKPQARFGVGLDPLSWLSIAADMDVTKNETVLADAKSQNVGGGVELHWNFASLRAGMYKNIAESGSKPVVTAGLGVGPHWLRLDVDAAVSTDTGRYKENSYPREAKVEFGLSSAF